ncbi:uncharacterized protein LTHEOB_4426 [Neofusicoccum parvum]|uniref:Uncharacterized protein LTHEOB_4426 n=1 Tax=Neofusicoccum parvum TaxID=310453 RepID=A0ACB5SIF3_9PEZI|nr:uncharacterized protein LTHEOB_4426 [Neofusicoccum parvum]
MSRKLTSPAAQLLRNSRLFSLPPPVPGPGNGLGTSAEFTSSSETSTQPFPTRQAIATPTSSLHRGDWGLKRPLPLRETTRSTAPTMRVYEVDTINLFTDFESAGDHVRTLEKWQEMNIPLSIRPYRNTASNRESPAESAFLERIDNTQLDGEQTRGQSKWKYRGPWVSGMTEGQFRAFLETKVRNSKGDFRARLKAHLTQKALDEARRVAREEGVEKLPTLETFKLSEEEFEDAIRALREDTALSSELSRLIRDFFDLPGVHDDSLFEASYSATPHTNNIINQHSDRSAENGPPSTHPSAGLSYLRSSAFLQNHPILGPQEKREPIEARLLVAQTVNNVKMQPKAGVGGVVSELRTVRSALKSSDNFARLKYDEYGGHKVWVSPERAYINSSGHVQLAVEPAVEEDVRIKQGSLKSREELEAKPAPKVQELDTRPSAFDGADGTAAGEQSAQLFALIKERTSGEQSRAPRRGVDQ